jgi:glycosyltransferase involved in cell wall biosynthesis
MMTSKLLTVAVAITAFNQSRYTRRAIESLCRATPDTDRFRFEFAVLDDCSTDDTEAVVRSFREQGVDYWRSSRNSGVTHLWNAAYRQYSGNNYLAIVNNDVIFTPNWCSLILNAMRKRGCVMGGPLTNGPGHVQYQDVRNFVSDYTPNDDWDELLELSKRLRGLEPFELDRINGFCMVFDLSLLNESQKNRSGEPFDPMNRNFGNEDEIQERLRPKPIVVPESFVFHYKRVTIMDGEGNYLRYRPPGEE